MVTITSLEKDLSWKTFVGRPNLLNSRLTGGLTCGGGRKDHQLDMRAELILKGQSRSHNDDKAQS